MDENTRTLSSRKIDELKMRTYEIRANERSAKYFESGAYRKIE